MTPIVWDADPVMLRLGAFQIRWYGALFAGAFVLGLYVLGWAFRREGRPVQLLDRLLVFGLIGALVGARLGHVLFYRPELFVDNPAEVLAVWRGGLASHGGAIGMIVALWLAARDRPELPYVWLLDRVALAAALGGTSIRIGNFFNSEIVGIPTDVPWAVVFARVDPLPRHPAQLYEAAAYLTVFFLLLAIYRRRGDRLPKGFLLGLFLVTAFGARFLIEFVKAPLETFALELPLSMGQLLSLPMIVAGAFLVWWSLRRGFSPPAHPPSRRPGSRRRRP